VSFGDEDLAYMLGHDFGEAGKDTGRALGKSIDPDQ